MSVNAAARIDEDEFFLSVRLVDLEAGEILGFDTYVFLPGNQKHIKLSQAGDCLDKDKIDKIRENRISQLFISGDDIQKYYEYSAKKLREYANSKKITSAERTERLVSSVKELMTDIFSPDSENLRKNQEALKNCSEIISAYILQDPESNWFVRVQEMLSELGDQYSHSGNVSTLAAMFSIGTGIGKPENLALAGLLHDVGLCHMIEIQGLAESEMTPIQLALYKEHPNVSLQLLAQKKIILSDSVTSAIGQHHEYFNGGGFPNGLAGSQICLEAQVLSFADRFDELTKAKPAGKGLSPRAAVMELKKDQVEEASKGKYQSDLLRDLLQLLPV